MITEQVRLLYREARDAGWHAKQAIYAARIMATWECRGRYVGDVRLRCEPETDNYIDVYGAPEPYINQYGRRVSAEAALKELENTISQHGLWCVFTERRCPHCGKWDVVDSIGMCNGPDHMDWKCNGYIVDLCATTLNS